MAAAGIVLDVAALYAAVGALVAAAFLLRGPGRALSDPGPVTRGARLLLIPGAILLWPIVLVRLRGGG